MKLSNLILVRALVN